MKLCLIEDDANLLKNLSARLNREPDMKVAGAYANAEAALRDLPWGGVDVLLSDIDLPGLSGVEAIRQACQAQPDLLAMAYTVCENRHTVFSALKAGAYGYVLKGSPVGELTAAIRELQAGGSPMSPAIARMVLTEFKGETREEETVEDLTQRELAVLKLVAEGLLYKEIGDRLSISPHTVHTFVKRIYGKLHAQDRKEALQTARRSGLIAGDGEG